MELSAKYIVFALGTLYGFMVAVNVLPCISSAGVSVVVESVQLHVLLTLGPRGPSFYNNNNNNAYRLCSCAASSISNSPT